MIPNFQEFMRPVLEVTYRANGQEIKLRDIINQLTEQFEFSDEDRAATLSSGKQKKIIDNRIGWARTYLTKAGLLQATRRAHSKITERGIAVLEDKNIVINTKFLQQFDEFNQFAGQKNEQDNTTESSQPNNTDITPDEALRDAYSKINEALAIDILERTRNVTPAFFESLLIDLLLAMGYGGAGDSAAHALGKSGDNGVDGVIDQDPLGVDQIYIQAKRYAQGNNIGAGDIRDFFGALNLKRAQKGIFITTSDFTASAKETARSLGTRMVLINGQELAKLMMRYNIGNRNEEVLYLKKIDEEFFEN